MSAYRAAARRLRSNLTAFDSHIEGRLPAELRADLRRVARTVGAARDTEAAVARPAHAGGRVFRGR